MLTEHITVRLSVNGREAAFLIPPGMRLLDLLRDRAGLTGTKEGCGAGECGACTVLLDGKPVPSCLCLAASCEGHEITTIEGLGAGSDLAPIQEAMASSGGVQCGFCTPGIVMTAEAISREGLQAEAHQRLAGNLCRCTGYTKIFEALDLLPALEARDD